MDTQNDTSEKLPEDLSAEQKALREQDAKHMEELKARIEGASSDDALPKVHSGDAL